MVINYRWRFESLKSRCVLIDREHLLTENNIKFKPVQAVEYNISEKDQQEAKPRIVSTRRSSTFENSERRSMTPLKEIKFKTELQSPKVNLINDENSNPLTPKIKSEHNSSDENKDNNKENEIKAEVKSLENELNIKQESPLKAQNPEKNDEILEQKENKENNNNNNNISSLQDITIMDNFSKLTVKPPSPMRPSQRSLEKPKTTTTKTTSTIKTTAPPGRSILSKHNDVLFKDTAKNVKFSAKADTVHNLSPNTPSPKSSTSSISPANTATNSNSIKTETTNSMANNNKVNSKSATKQTRTKSNIVVRRVVVSSKHD